MEYQMTVDQCRAKFAEAFEAYAQEGARMRDLLLAIDRVDSREGGDGSVSAQQIRLNEARLRYEEARCRYVEYVLHDFVKPGESV